MTGISLSKTQIKNKWDKLKADWTIWLKLKRRQTGTGWNNATQTIDMEAEWWKKAKNVSAINVSIILYGFMY